MARTTFSALFTIAILMSAAFVTSFSMLESAHAVKAVGNHSNVGPKSYGAKTAGKICGDQLCRDKAKSMQAEKVKTMMEPNSKSKMMQDSKSKMMQDSKSKMMQDSKSKMMKSSNPK